MFHFLSAWIQTFHREYLTLPNPKSKDKTFSESSQLQQTFKVSWSPSDAPSASQRTFMVRFMTKTVICHCFFKVFSSIFFHFFPSSVKPSPRTTYVWTVGAPWWTKGRTRVHRGTRMQRKQQAITRPSQSAHLLLPMTSSLIEVPPPGSSRSAVRAPLASGEPLFHNSRLPHLQSSQYASTSP